MHSAPKQFSYLLHIVTKELKRHFDNESQRLDLTLTQWRAVAHLSQADGISQSALANLCETDAVTIGGVVERLEAKGVVQRVPNPEDSRAKIVRLTEKAGDLVIKMNELANEIYNDVFQGISAADRETAAKVLEQMRQNLSSLRSS